MTGARVLVRAGVSEPFVVSRETRARGGEPAGPHAMMGHGGRSSLDAPCAVVGVDTQPGILSHRAASKKEEYNAPDHRMVRTFRKIQYI